MCGFYTPSVVNVSMDGDSDACGASGLEWFALVARVVLDLATVVLALLMLNFICRSPALRHNTFNVLFLSSYVVDSLANLSRVLLKHLPILFCRHRFVQSLLSLGPSLATAVNATEWYLSVATIFCGFFFNLDHMLLVVFPSHYGTISSPNVKAVMVCLTWVFPLLFVAPMLKPCCRSKFFDQQFNVVFEDKRMEDVYDTVDMMFESFIYTPIVFIFNFTTTLVLQCQYRKAKATPGRNLEFLIDSVTIRVHGRPNARSDAKQNALRHRKIEDELDLSLLNLVDQMVDAVGVAFYMLFWAGNNNWVGVDVKLCMSLYDISWEVSTVNQPFLFLVMFPKIRRRFFRFYRPTRSQVRPNRRVSIGNCSVHLR